jgi:hypothetical protein
MACCADYQTQRHAFHDLLRSDSPVKVLLYQGASGSGKTTLIESCLQEIPPEIQHIPFTFRPGCDTSLAEIFHRTCENIGWDDMPDFRREVERRQSVIDVSLRGSTQIGSYNTIQVVLQAPDVAQQKDNQFQLTRAWFNDINRRGRMTLMVFDGFEKAPLETQDWINGPFLGRVVLHSSLRVVISGQQIPDSHNIEWGHCCQRHELYGVPEAHHWLPVIQEMGREFPPRIGDPLSWLAGVCHALKGVPSEIIKIIENLPVKS